MRVAVGAMLAALLPMAMAVEQVAKESWSSDLETEHAAILAVMLSLVGVTLLGTLGVLAAKRRASMSQMIMTLVLTGIVVTGVVAWVVTYKEMRKAVESQVEKVLVATGSDVRGEVKRILDVGPMALFTMQNLYNTGIVNISAVYPDIALYNNALFRLAQKYSGGGVSNIYTGTVYDSLVAVYQTTTPTIQVGMIFPPGHVPNDRFVCFQRDQSGANCSAAQCGVNPAKDETACMATCNVQTREACRRDTDKPRFVTHSMDETDRSFFQWPELVVSSNPTSWKPSQASWFVPTDEPLWKAPYAWGSGDGVLGVGFTVSIGFRQPGSSEWFAVMAVDYTIMTLTPVLKRVQPTPGSVVTVITTDGTILSSSADTSDGRDFVDVEVVNEQTNPKVKDILTAKPLIAKPYRVVRERYGTYDLTEPAILHDGGDAILVMPLTMDGGLAMLCAVMIPYSDVLGDANDAATASLVLVSVLSLVCSLVVVLLVALMLRPLRALATDMELVAWMKVEHLSGAGVSSIASEVSSMTMSFMVMAQNLKEYKNFLPESLKVESDDDDDEESVSASRASGTSKRTESKRGSSKSSTQSLSLQHQHRSHAFSTGLTTKPVSYLEVNVRGSTGVLSKGDSVWNRMYVPYLEAVLEVGRTTRGVIDMVVGDVVCVSFNAVQPNQQNREKVVDAMCQLRDLVPTRSNGFEVSMGAAHGEARCGVSGCDGMKRFTVYGAVAKMAHQLQALCQKLRPKSAGFLDQAIATKSSTRFISVFLTQVAYHGEKPRFVAEVVGPKQDDTEEWMYAMAENEKTGYDGYNNAVRALYEERFDEAADLVEKTALPCTEGLKARIRLAKTDPSKVRPIVLPAQFDVPFDLE